MSLSTLRTRRDRIYAVAAASFAIAAASPLSAQVAKVEVQPFVTETLSGPEFLTGKKDGKRDTIAGELRIPRPGNDRLPVVILMHGVSGIGGNLDEWSRHLNALGVSTFQLDSFSGRGIRNMAEAAAVTPIVRIVDAYRALELLAKHPRVDPDRIAIMGFSHGGWAALYSSVKRFARTYGPADNRQFAAHIVFYTGCFQNYLDGDDVSDKPIRVFHGAADDWLPVQACRDYVSRLRTAGKDVALTEYPGAHHGFDARNLKEPVKLPQAGSLSRCRLEEGANGVMLNSETRQPFTPKDPCFQRGTTLAYDATAHAEVQKAVTEFVTAAFKLK